MRVGITCYPTYGGSGAVATELGLHLAERGHEVHFVTYDQPFRLGRFQERVYYHEVEMEDYPLFEHPPYTLALAVALHDAVLKFDLDLVHVHYAIPHATSAWIATEMLSNNGVKVITTLHGTDITLVGKHPSFQAITRFSILKSDGITAVSKFLRDETVQHFGAECRDIEVIPNFVDVDRYHAGKEPCHRGALAEEGEYILMHVSNFRPVKRVLDVVEIFSRVSRRIPSRLVMVGDGPERSRAAMRADELGVGDRAVFLGKHTAVDELLSCADLFLLTSETESFGLAALEAMSSGVPVVATRVGGVPEVIPDGEAGFLHDTGDVDGMADSVLNLLGDDERRRSFAAAARDVAVQRFSSNLIIPRYEDYYARVLSRESR